ADGIASSARVAFCALPHGESSPIVAQLYERGLTVLDLSADLRLHDPAAYKDWYGHEASPLCQEAVYGIPELARRDLRDVRLWAVPGCYPTASLLALAPLVDPVLFAREGITTAAKSGVWGAGGAPPQGFLFSEIGEGVRAYKVAGTHRHTPEIEQGLGARGIVFTPHLLPMT